MRYGFMFSAALIMYAVTPVISVPAPIRMKRDQIGSFPPGGTIPSSPGPQRLSMMEPFPDEMDDVDEPFFPTQNKIVEPFGSPRFATKTKRSPNPANTLSSNQNMPFWMLNFLDDSADSAKIFIDAISKKKG